MSLPVAGPFAISDADIAPLNAVFSEAFTERYRGRHVVLWPAAEINRHGGVLLFDKSP